MSVCFTVCDLDRKRRKKDKPKGVMHTYVYKRWEEEKRIIVGVFVGLHCKQFFFILWKLYWIDSHLKNISLVKSKNALAIFFGGDLIFFLEEIALSIFWVDVNESFLLRHELFKKKFDINSSAWKESNKYLFSIITHFSLIQ